MVVELSGDGVSGTTGIPIKTISVLPIVTKEQTSTSATYVNVDGEFNYDPSMFNVIKAVYFEALISISDATVTAYAQLYDNTNASAISGSELSHTGDTNLVRVRSGDIKANMPTSASDLIAQIHADGNATATIQSARLIIVQTEA